MPPASAVRNAIHAAPAGLAGCLRRLAAGDDPEAWSWLVANLGEPMRVTAYRLTGDASLADDALQEALLALRTCAGAFRSRVDASDGVDDQARRWILRVVANASRAVRRNELRAQRRGRDALGAAAAPPPSEPRLERAESARAIRDALDALPERERSAILLHVIADLGFEQVARELRCPVGSAKTWVRRGLTRLRARLRTSPDCVFSLAVLTEAAPPAPQLPLGISAAVRGAPSNLLPAPFHGAAMSKFCTAAVAALVLGGAIAYHVSAADDHASAPKPVLPPGASDAPAPTAFDHLETALDQVIKVQLVDAYIGDAAAFLHTAGGVPAAYDGDGKTLPVTITASHLPLRCLAELIAALSGTTLTYESGGLVFRPANDERLKTDLDRVVALPAGGSLPWGRAMDVLRSEGAPIVDSVPAETAALEVSFRQQDPQSGTEAASRPLRGWIDLIVSQRHQRWTVVHGWVAIGADALSRPSPAVAQALAKALDKNISVDFSESSFHDVVTFLTQIGGVDIIIGPGITDLPPITFKCKSMPLRTAMQWIANLTGTHCWTRAGAIIFDAGTDVSPLHPVEAHDEIKLQQQAATATAP